jgi:endonuclease YncB( thermonuclease family)
MAMSIVACNNTGNDGSSDVTTNTEETTTSKSDANLEWVDYVSKLKLNMDSETIKQVVTVHQYIDGDTTHFNVPTSVMPNGIFKARYLAINTPESTGQIEEWGKAASNFTKEALKGAESIIIESDDGTWNADSTGGRYLVWVWYKTKGSDEYRNLNLEILQNGLAIASNSANNRYGDYCMDAIDQARAHKLYVYSGEQDPDFFYGTAIELTIKELRARPDEYNGKTVAFEGVITKNDGASVYIENFDEETGMYHGISVYYGYNLNGMGMSIIEVGNRVRIVGSMQYYEAGGTYQISDLSYDMMIPDAPDNIQKISDGNTPAYVLTSPETFVDGKVNVIVPVDGEEQTVEYDYAEMALNSSISMKGLTVTDIYTTHNGGSNDGAMTLTCKVDGYTITVRTAVLFKDGAMVTESYFRGKTIDVKGIIDYYDGDYQIKVFSVNDVVVK